MGFRFLVNPCPRNILKLPLTVLGAHLDSSTCSLLNEYVRDWPAFSCAGSKEFHITHFAYLRVLKPKIIHRDVT